MKKRIDAYELSKRISVHTHFRLNTDDVLSPLKVQATFEAFDDIFILTYRFRHSIFRCYLDFWEKEYEHLSIKNNDGGIELVDFSPEIETGNQYAKAMSICLADKLNAIGIRVGKSYPLSSTW